jgi:AcrR family transcriptional regulator
MIAHDPHPSKKRTQIITTAEVLLNRYGIKRVRVEDICREAEVSKMTFYKYFSNKIDLARQIWNLWMDQGYAKLDEIDALDVSLQEKIRLMFQWKTNFIKRLNKEFIEELMDLRIRTDQQRILDRFELFIAKAQKRGEIRTDINPQFLIAVVDKLYELADNRQLVARYDDLMEFHREVKDFFWYGIIARPNQKETD